MARRMAERDGTSRRCAVTRRQRPVSELIRFVRAPGGEPVPDLKRRLPGRGVWITASIEAMREAVSRNPFAHGFKAATLPDPDLPECVGEGLRRAALDLLAMACKAGVVITGYSKVEAALANRPVGVLLHASDASADGRRKLAQVQWRSAGGASRSPAMISLFTNRELSLALGRPNVVHAALIESGMSETFVKACARLERYLGLERVHGEDDNEPATGAGDALAPGKEA